MLMQLEILFGNEKREPEYPMGFAQEFESVEDFIEFNIAQVREILDFCPEYSKVVEHLESRQFAMRNVYDILTMTVTL